jgi:hypothetical protein
MRSFKAMAFVGENDESAGRTLAMHKNAALHHQWFRFWHSHPGSAGAVANIRIKGPLANIAFQILHSLGALDLNSFGEAAPGGGGYTRCRQGAISGLNVVGQTLTIPA